VEVNHRERDQSQAATWPSQPISLWIQCICQRVVTSALYGNAKPDSSTGSHPPTMIQVSLMVTTDCMQVTGIPSFATAMTAVCSRSGGLTQGTGRATRGRTHAHRQHDSLVTIQHSLFRAGLSKPCPHTWPVLLLLLLVAHACSCCSLGHAVSAVRIRTRAVRG
jgi:hypothetical protein